jgi:hypothetical protein
MAGGTVYLIRAHQLDLLVLGRQQTKANTNRWLSVLCRLSVRSVVGPSAARRPPQHRPSTRPMFLYVRI